ncbi:MAG: aldo/keto reductase [Chloroflexi bacterium]|jgi:diketogulonate reductase-like aldo/keto reductase|nr:aldo/keto reductase [Chloroflexota bacterium]
MKYKQLHDGRPVPVLGLGTSKYGVDASEADYDLRALREALDMGYTHIDTAEVYAGGDSERLIGLAIQDYDRESLFITSKVSRAHLERDDVFQAVEGSLRRLRVDYIDLYLIHAPNPEVPLELTFEALNELVEQGKIRYMGVSNFDRGRLDMAFRLTNSLIATNQVRYSLFVREPEENGVLEYCQQHDILLTAYTPLEHGQLLDNDVLQQIAEAHGATAAQVALAWLIQKPQVIAIAQSANKAHLQENLGAVDLVLSDDEMPRLDRLSAPASLEDEVVPSTRGGHPAHGPFAPQ